MIQTQSEQLIRISEVPSLLPKRHGRKTHVASVYRWIKAGLSGVRLESVYVGGIQYSSLEALERFCQRVTEVKTGLAVQPNSARRSSAAHERAMRELDEAGI